MDISMIIGLTLAGLVVMSKGGKRPAPKENKLQAGNTQFVVRIGDDGAIAVGPKDTP